MGMLKVAVVVMGVLIIAGVVTLGVVLSQRVFAGPGHPVQTVLDEPPGTRILSISAQSDRLALQLQGGGPDRVVVIDLRTARIVARAALAH
jgi:hypothetical protein